MAATDDNRVRMSNFEQLKRAGGGAAAEVWKARSKRDLGFVKADQHVALKVYREDILKEPDQLERIHEEYQTGSRLAHPNLVKIFHVDIQATPPFLVMEWCEGETLLTWRRTHKELDDEFLLQFTTQMLDAIEFLHSSRRCHRDVKPTNVHIDTKGRLRLLDFGVIRSLRDPPVTKEGARFLGTYRYAAPEHIFKNEYGFQSDLYSFGATLYYLLHGKEIFAGVMRTPDLILAKKEHRILFEDKLGSNYGAIWKASLELCRQLLDGDPERRPGSALAALDTLAAHVPSDVPLRVYYACALTRVAPEREERAREVGRILRECGAGEKFSIYMPEEHTHPLGAAALSSVEVYWIDRERVASSDLLCVYADDPSHGVGQEAEIAANAGVPIVLLSSKDLKEISRMLRGIAGRVLAEIQFKSNEELREKALGFFRSNRQRLRMGRKARDREYQLRLGNRIRSVREEKGMSLQGLADIVDVSKELLESLETRPERLATVSTIQLRRIAQGLDVAPAELLRDQSGKEQEFEDVYRQSVATLRKLAHDQGLGYRVFAQLEARGREELRRHFFEAQAGRGVLKNPPSALAVDDWLRLYRDIADAGSSASAEQSSRADG